MKTGIIFSLMAVLLVAPEFAGELKSQSRQYAIVKAETGLRMRTSPDLKGKKIYTLPNNSIVEVLDEKSKVLVIAGKKGKWTKVKSQGRTGWVFGGFITKDSAIKSRASTITGFFEHVSESQYFKIVIKDMQGKEKTFWCFDGCGNIDKIKKGNKIKINWCKSSVGLIGAGEAVVKRIVSIKVLR